MAHEIWTIGHSNRDWETFLELLRQNSIHLVADVRRFPGSRTHPHFNQACMQRALECAAIAYSHFEALGGRRNKPAAQSRNTAWRSHSFNAYADYMGTPEFEAGLDALIQRAEHQPTAMMCAEALPWRCHRQLIADALLVRGWTVSDILGPRSVRARTLTSFARVVDGQLSYPGSTLFSE